MKILFSPEYSGHVFVKAGKGGAMMDTMVANVVGLLDWLEMRLGVHYPEKAPHERLALYYEAMKEYLTKDPTNVLASSFKTAGLSTAMAVLQWRDELRMAQWKGDGGEVSGRMKALVEIEKLFAPKDGPDVAERLLRATKQVVEQKLDCHEMELLLNCPPELLRPIVRQLLEALQKQGATVRELPTATDGEDNLSRLRRLIREKKNDTIELKEDDESLLIYRFGDELEANRYLSTVGVKDAEVWINADNKAMDNWMALTHQPLTGSMAADCAPQLTQLFVMGVGLHMPLLNINSLIEWLNMPIHPLESFFRSQLANTIVKQGGYRNEACKEVIEKYIAGEYVYLTDEDRQKSEEEQQQLRSKDKKDRERKVEVFLPAMEHQEQVDKELLKRFAHDLGAWCRQKQQFLGQQADQELFCEQLASVNSMAEAFGMLLGVDKEEKLDAKEVDSWVSTIYTTGDYTNAVAQQGCRLVVDAPAKVVSVAEKTVWMGVEGDRGERLDCAFLSPSERAALSGKLKLWEEEKENKYREQQGLMALQHTQGQLVLVTCDRRGGENTQKHPIVVRLEKLTKNLNVIERRPKVEDEHTEEVELIEKAAEENEVSFDPTGLSWPDHLSPTRIDTLVAHPFDYLMEELLHIEPAEKAQMSDVKRTSGNVAHAVIEAIFAPRAPKKYADAADIAIRLNSEFGKVYQRVIEGSGAVLQLEENQLTEKKLKEQLKECLKTLLEIIRDNKLKVTGCERMVKDYLDLGLPVKSDEDKYDIIGYMDMTLEDEAGKPVVFDFKWTSSRTYYNGLLEQNRSVQLELYRRMLKDITKKEVERVAYFLMPEGRLYSKEAFVGKQTILITAENDDDIVKQLCNAVRYRKEQLDGGVVEVGRELAELTYKNDTESKNLFPLKADRDNAELKADNIFSNYKQLLPQEKES